MHHKIIQFDFDFAFAFAGEFFVREYVGNSQAQTTR